MQLDAYQSQAIKTLLDLPKNNKKFITFSGGKDSTLLVGLALLAKQDGFCNFEIIHSNTLVEFPFMDSHILAIQNLVNSQGINFHYVTAPMEYRFFYSLIGKGYPVPHRSFRWCTKNMKLQPMGDVLKSLCPNEKYIAINGERLGESKKRDKKLSCDGTNECGINEQKDTIFKNASSLVRPLFNMSTCQVWDAIAQLDIIGILPDSYNRLNSIYSISSQDSGDSLRTGCIGCPLITNDKSLPLLTSVHPGYAPLNKLRAIYMSFGFKENRIMRADGKSKGAVLLSHRKAMYNRILEIEAEVQQHHPDFILIHPEERAAIEKALAEQRYPKGYSREYLLSVGAIDN